MLLHFSSFDVLECIVMPYSLQKRTPRVHFKLRDELLRAGSKHFT
jgi:hypothetical protein